VSQEENLRKAINTRKSRIAERAHALAQPLAGVDPRGRPYRVSASGRLRAREEQLHLEQAVAELEIQLGDNSPSDLPKQQPRSSATPCKLEQLRKDCNLTYERLAEETGRMDAKTVRGHCHGKPMRPSSRELYIKAFERLGHTITVADLQD
jgi:hypothetical protein